MQDTILRVFVVAVGLLYPRENPRVEEQDDDIINSMQEREEWLLRERVKLDQEMTLINQEVSLADQEGPPIIDPKLLLHVQPNESPLEHGAPQIDQNPSEDELREMDVKQGRKEEEEEEGSNIEHKLSQVHQGASDTNQTLTSESEGKPHVGQKPSQVDKKQPYLDAADVSHIHKNKDIPPVNQQWAQGIHNGGSLRDQRSSLAHQEISKTDQEVTSKEAKQDHFTDSEGQYICYLWNAYSLISVIHFLIKYLRRRYSQEPDREDLTHEERNISIINSNLSAEVSLPDSDTLNRFYEKCVKVSPSESWRTSEFVEGFASDLLEATRSMIDREVGMVIEDFMVEGMYGSLVCDIIVLFGPQHPYSFQHQLWCSQDDGDKAVDMEGCGRIKMVKSVEIENGCHCGTADIGDDMLCLLHCENEKVIKVTEVSGGPICSQNSPYLSRTKVTNWFQAVLRKAWGQISHKYEFELLFRKMDAPGTLMVRFRSGKVIIFNVTPVVKLKDTDVYFTSSPFTSSKNNSSDTHWTLSLAIFEDHFLKQLSKSLPENSCHIQCLEMIAFLHKKQTGLTGRSALTDYHLKTVFMHLLMNKEPSEWTPEHWADRMRDTYGFLEKSLQDRKLHHAFIGNPLLADDIGLPAVFCEAKPVNLFRPLVVQNILYTKTVNHLQEMLKNTSVLIQEYVPKQ